MNRSELLEELETIRERFLDLIDSLPDADLEEPGVNGDWSVKDILAHLTRWEAELVRLLWQASLGQMPTSAHFGSQSMDELNAQWFKEMQARPLERILEDFHSVRNQTTRRVEEFTDKQLEDPRIFPWSEGRALWEWIAADSFLHEKEHASQIRAWQAKA